jgi:hypothetical protein
MFIYWVIFIFISYLALLNFNYNSIYLNNNSIIWNILLFFFTLFIGLRFQVGGDWYNYLNFVYFAENNDFISSILITDPAYGLINWISAKFGFGPYFVNIICAFIFSCGLITFCKIQTKPFRALCIAFPYLLIVVAMGYTRQAVAISLIMLCIVNFEFNFIKKIFLFLLAVLFHKTSLIMAPLIFFSFNKSFFYLIRIFIFILILYFLILSNNIESLISGYIV